MPGATVRKLIEIVRELFNQPRQHYALWQSPQWHSVWSAIDGIELAQSAIEVYGGGDHGFSDGESYLRLQGLLQSFYIQQDSCKTITKYLNIPLIGKDEDVEAGLKELRNLRNSIAHPSDFTRENSHTIPSVLLGRDEFSVTSFTGEKSKTRNYKILNLISQQRDGIASILIRIISDMKKSEQDHRAKFTGDRIADIFRDVNYQCRIIANAATEDGRLSDRDLAPYYIETIQEKMGSFRVSMSERGLALEEYSLDDPLSKMEYPLAQIRCFFLEECTEEAPDSRAVYIFAEYIRTQFNELEKVAREIDLEYNSPVLGPDMD